ncbi:ATP-grasp domain-containing protein [Thiolapillus sp.]
MDKEKLIKLLRSSGVLRFFPRQLKMMLKSRAGFEGLHRLDWQENYDRLMAGVQPAAEPATHREVCIIHDWMMRHGYYEAACMELGVPYHVMDLTSSDWVEKAEADDSFIYFLRPFVLSTLGRTVYEERAYFLSRVLQRSLFPAFDSLWIYESKRRCASWLEYFRIPHARTWVFFSRREALDFLDTAEFPLVFKTDIGSDALGVRVLHSAREARRIVNACFGRGFQSNFYDPRDRNWGQVLFQQHLGDVKEWRMIRIGESFFAYQKGKKGEFHSGTKIVEFHVPGKDLLDFSRNALEKMGMNAVALDVFEDRDGKFFVNEVQAYYGANEPGGYYYEDGKEVILNEGETIEMMVHGEPGRFFHHQGEWRFEAGDFSRNAGCNLRVKLAFQERGEPLPGYAV